MTLSQLWLLVVTGAVTAEGIVMESFGSRRCVTLCEQRMQRRPPPATDRELICYQTSSYNAFEALKEIVEPKQTIRWFHCKKSVSPTAFLRTNPSESVQAEGSPTIKAEIATSPTGSSHGSTCTGSQMCRMKKHVCYRGICLCKPGLYFSPKDNACLKECEEFGDGMDEYSGLGIKGYNDQMYTGTTLTMCYDLCVREKAFTCLTAEWNKDSGVCQLSKFGFLDVFNLYREKDERIWAFAQRQCN